jgi:hypothetical protein
MRRLLGLAVLGAIVMGASSKAQAQVAVSVGNPYGYYGAPGVYVGAPGISVATYPVVPRRYVAPVAYGYPAVVGYPAYTYGYRRPLVRPFVGPARFGPYRRYYW